LAAGAGAQGISLENSQGPLAIAPRDVGHGTDEGHIFSTGEAGKDVMLPVCIKARKKCKKPTFSHLARFNTKKPLFCVVLV